MIIGAVALFICYKFTKERVVATAEQTANVKNRPFPRAQT
jgi:GPH family glycoside/pentoside/hexuronide:cation symporter